MVLPKSITLMALDLGSRLKQAPSFGDREDEEEEETFGHQPNTKGAISCVRRKRVVFRILCPKHSEKKEKKRKRKWHIPCSRVP